MIPWERSLIRWHWKRRLIPWQREPFPSSYTVIFAAMSKVLPMAILLRLPRERQILAICELFSEEINASFVEGMTLFGHKMTGFDRKDAILSGIESRTSSPIRIHRDGSFVGSVEGYILAEKVPVMQAITSAAMDGMKVAEEIIKRYQVNYES